MKLDILILIFAATLETMTSFMGNVILQFHFVVVKDFVEKNIWPELVPELKVVVQKSNFISASDSEWKTINTLAILKSIVKPFQVCSQKLCPPHCLSS